MSYIRESYLYHLFITFLSLWKNSALCHLLTTLGDWFAEQVATSGILTFCCRESAVSRIWHKSRFCALLTRLVNLPVKLVQRLYTALNAQFDTSYAAKLAFRLGEETPIAQSWLLLLLWIIPYANWNNGYTLIAFLLLLCLFLVRSMRNPKDLLDIPALSFYAVLFFGCICAAVPLSAYPDLSSRFLRYHIGAALCVLVTVSTVRHIGDLKRIAAGSSAALAVSSLYAVYQRSQGIAVNASYVDISLNPDMPGRVYSFFENPNSYAVLLILLIPLAAALFLEAQTWVTRLLAAGAALLGIAALLMTYSRACWVGFACAAVVFILLWNPRLAPICLVCCVICIPFLPSSIWSRILSIFNSSDSSTSSRLPLYEAALSAISKSPVTGVGLGTAAPQKFISQHNLYSGSHYYVHAHNLFLEIWLEAGLIGLLSFLAAVLEAIRRAARLVRNSKHSAARTMAAATAAALCGYLVTGLADYPWSYPRVMTVFWFVFAMTIASVKICLSEEQH